MPPPPKKTAPRSTAPPIRRDPLRFEPLGRWPNAPLICLDTNRPAFKTAKDADMYFKHYSPMMDKKEEWVCEFCGLIHRCHYPPEISGQSSGKSARKDNSKKTKR